MKDKLVQFIRKYKIALCAGITCVLVLVAVVAGMRGAVPAQAEDPTASVLKMLEGKEHPYVFVNEAYVDELVELKDNPYYSVAYAWVLNQAEKRPYRNSLTHSHDRNNIISWCN